MIAQLNKLELRRATSLDSDDILEWRNDPITRMNSVNSKKISKSEHEKWFDKKLSSMDTDIYIGYINDKKIGVVRIEKQDNDVAEVNININPSERGKGYGAYLLAKGVAEGFNKYIVLTAKVKKVNIPSIKIFEKVGFYKKYEDNELFFYQLKRKLGVQF